MREENLIAPEVFWDHAATVEDEETKALLLTAGNQAQMMKELLNGDTDTGEGPNQQVPT